jgi:hypothetical protein
VSIRKPGFAVPLAALLSVLAALAPTGAPRVAASCLPLDLAAIQRTETTSVFSGTITRTEAGHVWVQVEHWFLGRDPVDSAEVIGGSQPNVITSVDWMPSPGQKYLVVAERAAPRGFVTSPCQQAPADDVILQQADTVFGVPREGPFATATASLGPQAPGAAQAGQPDLLAPLLLLMAAGALALVLILLARRRRASGLPSR